RPDKSASLAQVLSRPEMTLDAFEKITGPLTPRLDDPREHERYRDLVHVETRYAGYLGKQARMVANLREKEDARLDKIDFAAIPSLRHEARLALERFQPETVGQASRLPGVNPADVDILLVMLRKGR